MLEHPEPPLDTPIWLIVKFTIPQVLINVIYFKKLICMYVYPYTIHALRTALNVVYICTHITMQGPVSFDPEGIHKGIFLRILRYTVEMRGTLHSNLIYSKDACMTVSVIDTNDLYADSKMSQIWGHIKLHML